MKEKKVVWLPLISLLTLFIFVNLISTKKLFSISPSSVAALTESVNAQAGFPVTLSGARIRYSSIALGDVNGDGIDDIVVGGSDGKVYAYQGTGAKLWEYDTGNAAVEGKAAIADIDQDGKSEIIIGAGSTFTTSAHGGLYVIDNLGNLQCKFTSGDFNKDGWQDGVWSSPAVADIDGNDGGKLEIAFGGWDAYIHLLNDDCSEVWRVNNYDTIWSSPAIADVNRDGNLDIIIGADSNDNGDQNMTKGGRIWVIDKDGNSLSGFPKFIDEVIFSSPAIGDFSGNSQADIMVGTGYFWGNPSCGHPDGCTPGVGQYANAWDNSGNTLPNWPVSLNGYTWGSPALADLDNDGELEMIINSSDSKVHALNSNGSEVAGWPVTPVTGGGVSFATLASPVVADVDGDGNLEVFLVSNWDVVAWDKNGNQLTPADFATQPDEWDLGASYPLNSAPAIGDIDGDGDVELVVGGGNSGGSNGMIYAWDFTGSVDDQMPWPVFRQNSLNQGAADMPPYLDVIPSTITILHEEGDNSPIKRTIRISNFGNGTVDWTVTPNDAELSASPGNGSLTLDATSELTVDTTGLALGDHTFSATVVGTSGGDAVANSPINVTITVKVVENVYDLYLPLIKK